MLLSQSAQHQIGVGDLQPGDVLIGDAQGSSGVLGIDHSATVLESGDGTVSVFSSDNRGIYIRDNADSAVGGRTFDVFRTEGINELRLRAFAEGVATEGGLRQYLGNAGGNVCTSVSARALEAAGGQAIPRLVGGLVTPNALRTALGPPIGRIYVPPLRTRP